MIWKADLLSASASYLLTVSRNGALSGRRLLSQPRRKRPLTHSSGRVAWRTMTHYLCSFTTDSAPAAAACDYKFSDDVLNCMVPNSFSQSAPLYEKKIFSVRFYYTGRCGKVNLLSAGGFCFSAEQPALDGLSSAGLSSLLS